MHTRHAVLTLCLGFTALGSARAQGDKAPGPVGFAAGVGATYGNLTGGDFNGSKAAAGFDASFGIVLSRWQLGVGYDRTKHTHADTDGDYLVSNVYFEPRLLFTSARRWTPYGEVRFGRAMASYEGVVGNVDKATGYIAGLGAGLVWPIARHFQADAAAHYDRLSHDYGTGGYSAAEKGGRTSLRVGVRYASGR